MYSIFGYDILHWATLFYDDLRVAGLINCVEYKKHRSDTIFQSRIPFNVFFLNYILNRSAWNAIHSCICDRKLTITSRLTLRNEKPTWCHLLFCFIYYALNMFRTLIYPSSGACDCVDELPHRSSCSVNFVMWIHITNYIKKALNTKQPMKNTTHKRTQWSQKHNI